jgi:hypothetical protein
MAATPDETIEQIAPGYYVVRRSEAEWRRLAAQTDAKLPELLAPIRSRKIAEEIERKYREAYQNRRTKA